MPPTISPATNLVLIGMPGVGKSTVGVLLAKRVSRQFLDTDVLIQAREGRRLRDIIEHDGVEAFRRIEERYVRALDVTGHVIATGGSVVYSAPAVAHLKAHGVAIHLHLPLAPLAARLGDLRARGVVIGAGQTLEQLYDERMPLYRRYADVTVECDGLNTDQVVEATVAALGCE